MGHIGTDRGWFERNERVKPFRANSLEELFAKWKEVGTLESPSLALIRPRLIERFEIKRKLELDWDERSKAKLAQESMLYARRIEPLEFIPFEFYYHFKCENGACRGHRMSVLDWEIKQLYRRCIRDYGKDWEIKLRFKCEEELIKKDLQFFVGTQRKRPQTWMIIGLYYPPKPLEMQNSQLSLQF